MKTPLIAAALAASAALTLPSVFSQSLFVDFNNAGNQDAGPHPEPGYQSYQANHEVAEDFISVEYPAFFTTVTFTPTWPDTTSNAVQQLIDRGAGNDNAWLGDKIDLLTDWIGIDTRTGNGGNGDVDPFPGDSDEFVNSLIEDFGTRMDFTLAGLPAGTYRWRSYHHDTESVHTPFYVDLSTDAGTTFTRIFNPNPDATDSTATEFRYWEMTNSSGNPNPPSTNFEEGSVNPDPADLPSTVEFGIEADGSDVVIRFIPLSRIAVHEQLLGVNGFELVDDTDSDGDGLNDQWERANFGGSLEFDGSDDNDSDFSNNADELARSTDPTDNDSDDDGLLDGHETNTGTWVSATNTGTDPLSADSDGDGLSDGVENPDLDFVDANQPGSDPNLADTDGDLHPDDFEVSVGTDPGDASEFPRQDGLYIDFSSSPGSHEYFYQAFIATDRTNADLNFDPDNGDAENGVDREETYPAFGTDVTLGVSFPDLLDDLFPEEANQAKRMLDRGTGAYTGLEPDLMRDFIGVDARLGSFGNGDFEPTSLSLTLTGIPAGSYLYRAFHHDNGDQNGPFDIVVTDADRTEVTQTGFEITTSPITPGEGNGPGVLSSTVNLTLRSNGTDPIVLTYQIIEAIGDASNSIIVLNGFQLTESEDSDGDGLPDVYETDKFGDLSQSGSDDFDNDGSSNIDEFAKGTDPIDDDTDDDGLLDGEETTAGSNPFIADTDGDGVNDGTEVKIAETDPLLTDSDGDGYNDGREIAAGSDPTDFDSFPVTAGALFVDFDSLSQDGGPHPQAGYQTYEASHEIAADFVPKDFNVFGTTVTFNPSFPDSGDERTMQMIDRGAGNDANWNGDQIDLLTDWIGVDTRTANGGNGNYSINEAGEITGIPTRMLFTFAGLPESQYTWRSYHHDTEHANGDFLLEVSTDGGTTFTQIMGPGQNGRFRITDSTPAGTPAAPMTYDGPGVPGSFDPAALPSTVNLTFTATGDDVVFQWTVLADTAVHRQFMVVNGFELVSGAPIVPTFFRINSVDLDPVAGEVALTWDTTEGKTYRVFFSESLENAQWTELAAGLTVGMFTDTLPAERPSQRFYKVEEYDN